VPVTDADVAHVRSAYLEFNERGGVFSPDELTAYFRRYYDDDAIFENVDGFPVPTAPYQGLDGYHNWYQENYSPYEDVRWEVVGMDAVGERVVARTWVRGRPRGEPTELEVQLGITYEMRRGRVAHVRVYLDHERALESARVTIGTNAE
jgi:ketosteroid isomerase-like protein